jgi:hypothetical protein
MPVTVYENFEVVITTIEPGRRYSARANCAVGGQAREEFEMSEVTPTTPAVEAMLNATARHIVINDGPQARQLNLAFDQPPSEAMAKAFGDCLFRAVFKNTLRSLFDTCLAKNPKLCLRFDLSQAPELAALPWEYLYNSQRVKFFAQFPETPVVRLQQQLTPIVPLPVEPPLRILVMTSIPQGALTLDVAQELQAIKQGIQALSNQNLMTIELLPKATPEVLFDQLDKARTAQKPFHIFHYIGHGAFDPQTNAGALLLEDENGTARLVTGDTLGAILYDFRDSLRLVVLNACEGARIAPTDSYSGFAQKVMQTAEIPAAIAMQFKISDKAAITFAEHFYTVLANGDPLEVALSRARLRLFMRSSQEWATPVMYLRAPDGYILKVEKPAPAPPIGPNPLTHLSSHFEVLRQAFNNGQLVIFLGLNVNLCGRQLLCDWQPGQTFPANLELYEYLRRTYQYPLVGAPLASLAQHLVVNKRSGDLYNEFVRTFTSQVTLPAIYPCLAQIVAKSRQLLRDNADLLRRRFLFVTNNYDNCFERAFTAQPELNTYHIINYVLRGEQSGMFQHTLVENGNVSSPTTLENPNTYKGLINDFPVILKISGAVESGQPNFAVTEDHFFALASKDLNSLLPPQIVSKLRSSHHLYIGCSLRDWTCRALLYSIWEDRKPTKYESWAVVTDDNDENTSYWKNCGVEIVEAQLGNYIENLQQHLCH